MVFYSLVLSLLLLVPQETIASACCGGGGAFPNLILGDFSAQFSAAFTNTALTHDSNPSGAIVARNNQNQEVLETLTLSGMKAISPLWQIGTTIELGQRTWKSTKSEESSRGVGDLRLQVAYEYMPEYGYSLWRPRGFIYFEQTVPLGRSIHESQKPLRTDSLGGGHYSSSLGLLLVKVWGSWDALSMLELHRGLKREFNQSSRSIEVDPGLGGSAMLGIGKTLLSQRLRLGSAVLYRNQSGREISSGTISNADSFHFWQLGLNMSYTGDGYSAVIAYQDQSFFAQASNTALGKSMALTFNKFFEL